MVRSIEKEILKILSKGNWQEIELQILLKQSVSDVLKKLEKMGLITKSEVYHIYSITSKGKAYLKVGKI